MTKKRILTSAIVLGALAALIYLQVQHWRSFDWARFRAASHVHLPQIAAAVGLTYLTYILRAVRWKIFLEPVRRTHTSRLIAPTFIGFSGLALIGRPGEFIRPYLISKKENVSLPSQIGVWTVERIFDVGAFTVLMTIDVFSPTKIQGNPYLGKFRVAAVVLCALVAIVALSAVMLRRRGNQVAEFLHRASSKVSAKLARHVDQKVRAFGEGLNTIATGKSFLMLVVLSLTIWFLVALAYREVAHAYPSESPAEGPAVVDVETATWAHTPALAGQELNTDTIAALDDALRPKGYSVKEQNGDVWLFQQRRRIKRVGDRPHLHNMDISHVLLLMGFSMIGSIVQLPAVGGGSQLAVISALQAIYGIPPEMAVSCGILLWLVTFMSCVPVGLILAHREHLSLRKLSAESHTGDEAGTISTVSVSAE
jgi:uncharacterized protein (TIRG00374 family)